MGIPTIMVLTNHIAITTTAIIYLLIVIIITILIIVIRDYKVKLSSKC